jgi:hypothetical protein
MLLTWRYVPHVSQGTSVVVNMPAVPPPPPPPPAPPLSAQVPATVHKPHP